MTWTKISEDKYVSGQYVIEAVYQTRKKKVSIVAWNPIWLGDHYETFLGRRKKLEDAMLQCEKYATLLVERVKADS